MNKLIYDINNLKIIQKNFDANNVAKSESIFTQGNGYLGIRAVDEERFFKNKEDFFVNGIFNIGDPNEVSELANLADLIQTSIFIDNQEIEHWMFSFYEKSLNLQNGLLERKIKVKINKKEFNILFQRIVDQDLKHLYSQKIIITQISGKPSDLLIVPLINGQTTNRGVQHFKEGAKTLIATNTIQYLQQTTQSNDYVLHTMDIRTKNGNKTLKNGNDDFIITMARRQVGFRIKAQLELNKNFVLEKVMSVFTSIDKDFISLEKMKETSKIFYKNIMKKANLEKLVKSNKKHFNKIYKNFDVQILGKSQEAKYANLALIFSLYHMNHFVPQDNPNLSVGAKGLSGEGYQGHCYWDTEFFIVPNYLFTNPKVARNLLEYRYKGIKGARQKAQEKNIFGAQYPWEMAKPQDGEVTPFWGQPDIITGKQVPIASREQEIHVSGDVAFAVDQYFHVTKDKKFMEDMGYEMIIDTAIFWANRAEKKDEKYQITNVMGPNEYKGNIDNNNFINLIAKRNLELALKYIDELKIKNPQLLDKINNRIPYQYSLRKMKDVRDNLVQQLPNVDGIIAENDQFLQLKRIDVRPFQFLGDAGKKLFNTKEGHKRLASQLVKQADVLLSTYVFKELFSNDIIEKNFNFYEPVTTHDSSLSAVTYGIMAIDLRKETKSHELFKYAIDIDLGTNFQSSNEGIHAGSLAAIWQLIVFGYGGFRFYNQQIHFNPILPENWDVLKYSVIYDSQKIVVEVNRKTFSLKLENSNKKELEVYIDNKVVKINNKKKEFKILPWLKD